MIPENVRIGIAVLCLLVAVFCMGMTLGAWLIRRHVNKHVTDKLRELLSEPQQHGVPVKSYKIKVNEQMIDAVRDLDLVTYSKLLMQQDPLIGLKEAEAIMHSMRCQHPAMTPAQRLESEVWLETHNMFLNEDENRTRH